MKLLLNKKNLIYPVMALAILLIYICLLPIRANADTPGTINDNNVNIRSQADATSTSLGKVNSGDKVTIIEEVNSASNVLWYKVTTATGTTGYIRADFVTKSTGGDNTNTASGNTTQTTTPAQPTTTTKISTTTVTTSVTTQPTTTKTTVTTTATTEHRVSQTTTSEPTVEQPGSVTTNRAEKDYPTNSQGTKWGDAKCDNTVDVSDAVLICKFISGDSSAKITETGISNASVVKGTKQVDLDDVTKILKYITRLISAEELAPQ